ncbi:hypothetical protein [Nocardioides sp. GY 10127]|uniref:hypothetical protein n=1 Tax=Nocardioides sp. GY 10127 TaxID=2569762 RepID=UPI0010A8B0D9|nr:hypothetical protein [Nocardioides sp. GY 10127]TIC85540.1 hypothetical protein E8D37_02600 [Nocardioides sp. GY 10127]
MMRGDGVPAQLNEQTIRAALVTWADVVYLQTKRLWDSTEHLFAAARDERIREQHVEQGSPAEWQGFVDEASRELTPRALNTAHADKYFLLLAVAQVIKCASRLPDDGLPSFGHESTLTLLRNIEEHWEDPTGRSATELRESIPDIAPGRLRFDGKRVWIEDVSLADVVEWVSSVELRVRERASRLGPELPPRDSAQWLMDMPPNLQLHLLARLADDG